MHRAALRSVLALALLAPALPACNQERNESIRKMNQGLALHRRNKDYEAVQELAEAARIDPKNERAVFYQGLIEYQELGKLDMGEQNLRKAISLNGNDGEYHYHLGSLLSRKGDWRAAIGALEQAAKLRPEHGETHLRLGIALERIEQFDRAQAAYHESIKRSPRLPEAYNALGNLYRRFDQVSHAAQVFRNGVENNPAYALNYHDLGLVYKAQQRYDDAIKQFDRSMVLDPANSGALFNLGMTHLDNQDRPAALKALKQYVIQRKSAEDPLRVRIANDMVARLEAPPPAEPAAP